MSGHTVVTPGRTVAERSAAAVADPELQQALRNLRRRLYTAREVERHHRDLKERGAAIRRETLRDLDSHVARASAQLRAHGAQVHEASTPAEARDIVLRIARDAGATRAIKSKSMATEEIDLAGALQAAGVEAVETDLGEYIVQVAGERPSHMITPAIHKTLRQIAAVLEEPAGHELPVDRDALTDWARAQLRAEFLAGDLGITGANFVTADTGTVVLVTNEGNADLCTIIPRVQVVVAPVEKVIPRFTDLGVLIPLLTRSATGQRVSNYLTMLTGPRRADEVDGPEELHVVFLDHNRRRLLGTAYEEMLACIRCGACLNVCPVYRTVSGHAYDSVYTGPMGKVLTPLISLGTEGRELPGASSLCGACTEACPVRIPLADYLVRLRADLRDPAPLLTRPAPEPARPAATPLPATRPGPSPHRLAFEAWARAWATPAGYVATARAGRLASRVLGRRWARHVPGAGGWTAGRDLPLPAARSFRQRWAERGPDGAW